MHYEKFADGSVKCIENEIPFDLPDGWVWGRLTTLLDIFITGPFGSSLHKSDYVENGIPLINPMNIVDGEIIPIDKMQISNETVERLASFKVIPNDIVIARRGDMGRCAVVHYTQTGWLCGTGSFVLRLSTFLWPEYFAACIRSPYAVTYLSGNSIGNTMLNLNQAILKNLLLPVPPFKEQKRIIDGINNADAYLNQLSDEREHLIATVAKTKAKILDLAIRGQLVPQNPSDEPASVLLGRIRIEKEELIRQGKLKRDKKESVIFRGDDNSYYRRSPDGLEGITDDLPYDIPDSWEWTSISELFSINPRNKIAEDMVVSFIPMPLIDDGYSGCHRSETKEWKSIKTGFSHFQNGDIGIAKITPCFENRKSVIFRDLCNGYGAGTTELHILRPQYRDCVLPEYALALLKSERFIQSGVQAFTGAVGQQRIGKDYVMNTYFPLPPYAEQRRIIDRINKLFTLIATIESAL